MSNGAPKRPGSAVFPPTPPPKDLAPRHASESRWPPTTQRPGDPERRGPHPGTRIPDILAAPEQLREGFGNRVVGNAVVTGVRAHSRPQPSTFGAVQLLNRSAGFGGAHRHHPYGSVRSRFFTPIGTSSRRTGRWPAVTPRQLGAPWTRHRRRPIHIGGPCLGLNVRTTGVLASRGGDPSRGTRRVNLLTQHQKVVRPSRQVHQFDRAQSSSSNAGQSRLPIVPPGSDRRDPEEWRQRCRVT